MPRYIHQGWWFDGNGKVVKSGTVTAYLAGTTTLASVYTASTGGVAVNSVTASSTDGSWSLYVDTDEYARTQKFKFVFSHAGFTSKTVDNVVIFPEPQLAWINVKDHGAVGNGVTDDTASIQETIDSLAGAPGTIYFPSGTYLVTSTLTIANHRQGLVGDGRNISNLLFNPAAADTLIDFSSGTATAPVEQFMRGFGISGSGSTKILTGIRFENTEQIILEDISISSFTDATKACVGIQSCGKHMAVIRRVTVSADIPIQISQNPHKLTEGNIDCDHYHLQDLYLIADATQPCMVFDNKVNVTNFNLDGFNAFNTGKNAIYWVESTSDGVNSNNVTFANIRFEQDSDASAYAVDIQSDDAVYNLTIRNFYGSTASKGFNFDKVANLTLDNCWYTNALEALTVTANVVGIDIRNCFWAASSTATLTGQYILPGSDPITTGQVPRNAYYSNYGPNMGTATLNANATTTLVASTSVLATSRIVLTPTSATAGVDAGSATGVYITAKNAGVEFEITHPNTADADKSFDYIIFN
jgi:hypothetical protein